MATAYILYNPLSGNGDCLENARNLEVYIDDDVTYVDITRIKSYPVFINVLEPDDFGL